MENCYYFEKGYDGHVNLVGRVTMFCRRGVPAVNLLLICLLWVVATSSHPVQKRQYQFPLPDVISQGCIDTATALFEDTVALECLTRLGDSLDIASASIVLDLTTDQLDYACVSPHCAYALTTLVVGCEVCCDCCQYYNKSTVQWCT